MLRVSCHLIIVDMLMTHSLMPDLSTARHFLNTLNHAHPAIRFTMELENDGMLPFLGIQLLNLDLAPRIETKVFVRGANKQWSAPPLPQSC